jgi:signal peptidase
MSRAEETRAVKTKGVLHYVGFGLSVGLLAFVVLIGVLVIGIPLITGSTPMTILTSSMVPTYPPGTLIIVKPVDADEIRLGDAITYQLESGKPEVVTHRVVAISQSDDGTTFTTRGDNNNVDDPKQVKPVQVRGAVWYAVPYIGYANTIVNGPNRAWIVPVIAVALFAYAGYMFASGITQARRRRNAVGRRALREHSVEG